MQKNWESVANVQDSLRINHLLACHLSGILRQTQKPREFHDGKVLDPISGKVYKGKARLSANGKRLTLRGYVGVSVIGRSVTWIKY